MKKNILAILFASVGLLASAQTEYDAIRLTQTDLNGTARYMSMGGAFGALGGDASALKDNPAGLGVFRSSEISATLNTSVQGNVSNWYGTSYKDDNSKLNFNHFSYIMALPMWQEKTEGLLSSNFSFTYNKNKSFSRTLKVGADNVPYSFTDFLANFTNQANRIEEDFFINDNYNGYLDKNSDGKYAPWLSMLGYWGYLINPPVDQNSGWTSAIPNISPSVSNYIHEYGSINDYSLGWGGNWNNNFYLGANLNISNIEYSLRSNIQENFGAENGNFDFQNYLDQNGFGVNLKVGAIYMPSNNLRLGLAVHTPTLYNISEVSSVDLYSTFIPSNETNPATPRTNSGGDINGSQTFRIRSAFQGQVSAAYLFGKKGLISAEYNFINYPGMRFSTGSGSNNGYAFSDENDGMKKVLRNGHVLKLGAELKVDPSIALRAGYAMYTGGTNPNYKDGKAMWLQTANTNTEYFNQYNTNYATLGMGYRQASWFIDFAYALKLQKEDFFPYQSLGLEAASVKTNTHNIAMTVGFKL